MQTTTNQRRGEMKTESRGATCPERSRRACPERSRRVIGGAGWRGALALLAAGMMGALAPRVEAAITATGGTVMNYTENTTNWTAHIFTNSVNVTLNTNFNVTACSPGDWVQVLVVAGGGGGGTRHGGGGGGGGLLTGATNVTAQSYTIIVGEGGIGGPSPAPGGDGDKYGRPGSNSVFGAMTAYGGGGGKTHSANGLADGGCGGGGCGMGDNAAYRTGGTGSQGYNGGNGASGEPCGGGGGGAGSIGTNAHTIANTAGAGGSGAQSTFASGVADWYAGGGGGGADSGHTGGAGGQGGGGHGGDNGIGTSLTAGTDGKGGGGGGCRDANQNVSGARGGSGIVIVRYVSPQQSLPAITNLAAMNITSSSADLRGSLTSTGTSDTAVSVYWGPNDAGTNGGPTYWAYTNSFGTGLTNGTYVTNTSYTASLSDGTTYYYNFFAQNAAGGVWAATSGVSQSFTTLGKPSVTVSAASGIGVGAATLNGTMVSTNGYPSTFFFCWGTNDFGTNSLAPWTVLNCGTATNGQSVSTNLTGLTYGIRYWYRVYATNAAGVAWSAPTNFVTAAPTGARVLPIAAVPVAWYRFDNAANFGLDSSPNGFNMTVFSSPSAAADAKFGGAVSWNQASSQYMALTGASWTSLQNKLNTAQTAVMWIKKTAGQVAQQNTSGIMKGLGSGSNDHYTWDNSSAYFMDFASSRMDGIPAPSSANQQVWHMIALVRDPTDGSTGRKVFFNPASAGATPAATAAPGTLTWGSEFDIGLNNNNNYFGGAMDDFILFNTALSTADLSALYNDPGTFSAIIAITNTTATAVQTTSATLNGTLTGSNVYFDVYAYWGPTDGTNNAAAWSSNAYVGAYTLTGAVTSASIAYPAACVPDTGYWYTLCASNAATNIWATPSKTFITGEATVQATDNTAQFKSPPPHDTGVFTIRRPATCTNVALTVAYTMSGTATTPTHYTLDYPGSVTLAAGSTSAVVTLTPTIDGIGTAILTLTAGNGYPVGTASNDTVTISAFVRPGIYVSTNGTQQSPYDTWDKACTNLQAALDYAAPILGAKIYLAGNQTFSTPGGDPTSLYVWQNATNGTLSGGWDTNAAPPDTRIGGTVLKRLAASGNIRVMKMASLTNCTVESVTFREGRDVARVPNVNGGINGAGVYMSNCWNVTMADCAIAGNTNTGENAAYGEGLGLTGSSAVLTNCTIADNYQPSQYSGGTGIYVDPSSRLTVLRSFILRNKGNNEGGNGNRGMGFNNAGVLNLIETVVSGNEAQNNAFTTAQYGGGYNSGILTMQNCLVMSNRTYGAGFVDGLYLNSGTATLVNCTFANNWTNGIQYAGGTVAMTNCIVWGHANADLVSFPQNAGVMTNVFYSSIGTSPNNDGVQGCVTPATGPRFADATYFHLASAVSNYSGGYFTGGTWTASAVHSALIDVGDTNSPYGREPAPNGSRINLGYDGNTEVASLSQTLAAAPPTVTNLGAIAWGHRTALLRGQVLDPGYPNPQAYLRYWQVGSGVTNEISKGEQVGAFSATATNLTPGATYQYVAVAINASSNVVTEAKTFVMHPTPSYLYVATNGDNTAGTNWITAYSDAQTALNLAEPADTIYVAGQTFAGGIGGAVPGHPYNAFLIWQNATNVTVRGGYDAASGGGSNPGTRTGMTVLQRTLGGVRVLSMIDVTNCTLEQVTIRDGLATERGGYGVYLTNCWDVTFASCVVSNNNGTYYYGGYGLGMFLNRSSVVLTNTTIANNIGLGQAWSTYGAGIYIDSLSRMTAIRSSVKGNGFPESTGNPSTGPAFDSCGVLELFETVVSGNSGGTATSGGGIYNEGTLRMRNCLVYSNTCLRTDSAAAIHLAAGSATIINCTIASNNTIGLRYAGGTAAVTNCIIWGHIAADATNFPAGSIGYSLLAIPNLHGVNGCITNDPLFVNAAAGNYQLQTNSPCVDAGTNQAWMTSGVDLAGAARLYMGVWVDMGAYETVIPPSFTVTGGPFAFGNAVTNRPSAVTNYTVSGSYLTNNLTVGAPAGFQVSTNGSLFGQTATVPTNANGFLTVTNVYVRFRPTAEQPYGGNVTNDAAAGAAQMVGVTGTGVVQGLSVNPGSLVSFGNVITNRMPATHSYVLAGSNLTDLVTVRVPSAMYWVSTNNTDFFNSSLPLTPSGDTNAPAGATLSNTTVWVKFAPTAAGTYGGSITNSSTSASDQLVSINGTGVVQGVSVSTNLLAFGNVLTNRSVTNNYSVAGSNLSASVVVGAPTGYQVSTNTGSGFGNSVTLVPTVNSTNDPGGATLTNTTVWVKFAPPSTTPYNNSVTNTSLSALDQLVNVTGTGVAVVISFNGGPFAFGNVITNKVSTNQNYTVSGSNLLDSVRVSTPSSEFQVSTNSGADFGTSLTLYPAGDTNAACGAELAEQTVYVRFAPTTPGSFGGSITNTTFGLSDTMRTVSGTGVVQGLRVSETTLAFGLVQYGVDSNLTYTLAGSNLEAAVVVSAPAGFAVSTNGANFAGSVTVTPAGDLNAPEGVSLPDTVITVKFTQPQEGVAYSGTITNRTIGAVVIAPSVSGRTPAVGTVYYFR